MEVVVRIQIIEGLGPGITERTKRETSDLKGGSKMKEFTIDLHDGRGNIMRTRPSHIEREGE
jgi:hypothetical protein